MGHVDPPRGRRYDARDGERRDTNASLSSLASDRQRKGSLYARAGLADYWVLNLVDRVLEVYREPAPDAASPFGWRYTRTEVFDGSARVAPLAVPGSSVRVADLPP